MDLVHIDFRKWNGARHWQFDMRVLGEDSHGLWLWSPPGSDMQRGNEPIQQTSWVNVKVIPDNKWWTAIWNNQLDVGLYIDIITPPTWNSSTVTMVDIDLDVKRWTDGRVAIADEEEFEQHQVEMEYPQRLIDTARATTARIALAAEARHEPFGAVGDTWMLKAIDLAGRDDG